MASLPKNVLLFCFAILTSSRAAADFSSTISDGVWSDASIWSRGVPSPTDSVYIRHFVNLDHHLVISSPGYLYVDTSGVICGHYDIYMRSGSIYNRGVIRIDSMNSQGHYFARDGLGFLQCTRAIRTSGMGTFSHSTGCGVIVGRDFDCNNFIRFTASATSICAGDCIDFSVYGEEMVLNVQPERFWYFPGASGSSGSTPDQVCYDSTGIYDVTLATRYGNCRIWHTVTRHMYIDVGLQRKAIIGLKPVYCEDDLPDMLTGVPPGGVFSGTGIYDNIFLPKDIVGTHVITYKVDSGCTDLAQQTVTVHALPCEALGITDHTGFSNLRVYPNPFNGRILIDADSKFEDRITIQLLDLTGRALLNEHRIINQGENTITIEIEEQISSGMYFLKLALESSAGQPLNFQVYKLF